LANVGRASGNVAGNVFRGSLPDLARIAGAAGVSNGANGKETSTLCFKQSASVALLAIAGSLSLLLGVELLLAMEGLNLIGA